MIPVIKIATTWMKHVAKDGEKIDSQEKSSLTATPLGLTRLEDECTSEIHVPTVACWLDTLIGTQ
jgi:hypothetical protein